MTKITFKHFFFAFSIIIYCNICEAQNGVWTWIHGTDTSNSLGNYGVKGMPADSNMPSGRYEGAHWTDLNGNFWIFGGVNLQGYANDLWKYNSPTNQWTWINGPKYIADQNGEFGVKGVPSPTNYPSARSYGSNSWTDYNGNLWLYGGRGYDVNGNSGGLSDLWKYNIATNEWTWISGSNLINISPVYGTIGVASPTNNPGARLECKSGWVVNDNLWMFGGQDGAAMISINVRNDMWKYDISTNQWTWMKVSNILNSFGNYGVLGTESVLNLPPARMSFAKWKGADSNFYIFGGGTDSISFNDVWKYNLQTNNWTWASGTNIMDDTGKYSVRCIPSLIDIPHARIENSTIEFDVNNKHLLWTFGGFKKVTNANNSFNDLWIYNMDNKNWTWVSGSDNTVTNPIGDFGTKGVSAPSNMIPSRGGNCLWKDNANNLYFYGGLAFDSSLNTFGYKNDLWKFEPDTSCFYEALLNTSVHNVDDENKIILYPNPSNGKFIIETNGILSSELEIYNVTGEKIFNTKLIISKSELNLKLANGIYFYQIKRENRIIGSGKLLIQN